MARSSESIRYYCVPSDATAHASAEDALEAVGEGEIVVRGTSYTVARALEPTVPRKRRERKAAAG